MHHFTPAPVNVRVVAIGLTVLAHLLVLLAFSVERRMSRRDLPRELSQFVSIWPDLPPPPLPPQPAPSPRPQSALRAITPVATPQEVVMTFSPAPSPQPAAPDPGAHPTVDWVAEGQKAALRVAANPGRPDTFSPPPNTNLPARLCSPRVITEAMQAKMDEVAPPRVEPTPPPDAPSDSVMMPGGIRVGILRFGSKKGKKAAQFELPEDLHMRPRSSVPDPNTCD